jgi:glycopeptide antibiotics resistance protein
LTSIEFIPNPLSLGLLILILLLARARRRTMLYRLALALFGMYLLAVIDKIAFPIHLPERWPAYPTWEAFFFTLTHMVNLIPGNYGNMFSDLAAGLISPNVIFWEIAGNILLTVPFGLGISLFYPVRGRRILWLALAAGLALEGLQLLIMVVIGPNVHAVDINDVLLNALGVLIGYGLYRAAAWGVRQAMAKLAERKQDGLLHQNP